MPFLLALTDGKSQRKEYWEIVGYRRRGKGFLEFSQLPFVSVTNLMVPQGAIDWWLAGVGWLTVEVVGNELFSGG